MQQLQAGQLQKLIREAIIPSVPATQQAQQHIHTLIAYSPSSDAIKYISRKTHPELQNKRAKIDTVVAAGKHLDRVRKGSKVIKQMERDTDIYQNQRVEICECFTEI